MPKCIIITGMGRSGTSLTASLIYKAGVNLGERLVAPGRANPHGFFEDTDFYKFHECLLLERGHTILVPPQFRFEPTNVDFENASLLIASRADKPIWGWKDPRTSLFLDFWHHVLPVSSFLFIYRHPIDVLNSLLRSNTNFSAGLLEGLDAWHTYNARIRSFYEKHPEKCLLCHSYAIIDRIDDFQRLLAQRLNLDLPINRELLVSVYRPEELRRAHISTEVTAILKAIHPRAAALYDDLNTLADLPFIPQESASSSELVPLAKFASSLPTALNRSQARGLLMQLVASIEPDTTESFFQEFQNYINQLEASKFWLGEQRDNWQVEAEQRGQRIVEQQRWITELEEAKVWIEQQRANWQAAALHEQELVVKLKEWDQQLLEANAYLEQQLQNWQRAVRQEQQLVKDLQAWNRELERSLSLI